VSDCDTVESCDALVNEVDTSLESVVELALASSTGQYLRFDNELVRAWSGVE